MSRRTHLPNILTVFRLLLVVPVVVLMLRRSETADWVAFAAFSFAALTDGVDGALARKWEVVSSAGQFLDPLVDKVLVGASMAVLVHLDRFPVWAAIVIVAREVAVTALRIAATRRGRGFAAARAGKWKATAQLVAVGAYVAPMDATAWVVFRGSMLALAIVLTLTSGWMYFRRAPELLGRPRQAV